MKPGGSPTLDRMPLLFNNDIAMLYVEPDVHRRALLPQRQADEVVYVARASGVLESVFGDLPFGQGDYLVIHRNITHRWRLDPAAAVEAPRVRKPRPRPVAQALPQRVRATARRRTVLRARHPPPATARARTTRRATFRILVKQYEAINELMLDHHPFDVVGWDGYFYPWAFNIHDFEPIVGRIHQPPPVHQTFQGDGFVICSFCPRPFDFHPAAVPAPYNHSNVDSDEVLYYASSEFMSRKGIEYGCITHHPDGIPHGPHPGRAEASIGAKYTNELAVMMDSFRPLRSRRRAIQIEDPKYHLSWIDAQHASFNPPTS